MDLKLSEFQEMNLAKLSIGLSLTILEYYIFDLIIHFHTTAQEKELKIPISFFCNMSKCDPIDVQISIDYLHYLGVICSRREGLDTYYWVTNKYKPSYPHDKTVKTVESIFHPS